MVTPAAKREAVAHLRSAFEMSERRACRVTGCVRMTMRYRSRRLDDQALRERLRALAHERRRFGYRRLHVFLKREGYAVNHKRLFRLYPIGKNGWRFAGVAAASGRWEPVLPWWCRSLRMIAGPLILCPISSSTGAACASWRWSTDCTRECLALVADTSISGLRVARELDRLLAARAKPTTIVSDNVLRHRIDQQCGPAMGRRQQDRLALYRARQADPERIHRVVHRPAAGRVAQ